MLVCNQKDLMPLTIKILNLVVTGYVCNTYKYLIQVQCPDIKEYVNTDELDVSSLQLLLSVTEQPVKAACDSVTAIYNTAVSLSNIYGFTELGYAEDPALKNLALRFCEQIIIDDFPSHAQLSELSLSDYQTMLACFSSSTIELIGCLCTLVAHGRVDLESIWEPDCEIMTFLHHDYSSNQNFMALDQLQLLGRYLCKQLQISHLQSDK